MTYLLYGITLAFTWFLALNVALSLGVAATVGPVSQWVAALPSSVRANTLLALRLLPAILSLVFVIAVFVPSFVALEPRAFDEAFGMTTTAFAIGSCVLVAAGLWRGSIALRQAAVRSRRWLAHARPVALDGAAAPAFCLDAGAPAMTLVGVLRPRLLVTQSLLDALTPDELRAALAHEVAHSTALDNFKRLAMRAVPDALSVCPASRRLEYEWMQAAEYAADARAARDARTRLTLASALVKVAQRAPSPLAMPALSSPLVGGDGIASRIARLLEAPERGLSAGARIAAALVVVCTAAGILVGYHPLLSSVHQISEIVVHVLP